MTSTSLIERLNESLSSRLGIHFHPDQFGELEKSLVDAARELGLNDTDELKTLFLGDSLKPEAVTVLIGHLTVGETMFFREKKTLKALEEKVFPELIASKSRGVRSLRIWSAACCTGEEPYTIAMMLDRLLPEPKKWDVSILGTDINAGFLKYAKKGVYRDWAFRGVPKEIQDRYFTQTPDGRHEISERIRNKVRFSKLNLADAIYPAESNNTNAIDLILCRNVFIYFKEKTQRQVVAKFKDCLNTDGWLAVGLTETASQIYDGFTRERGSSPAIYKKSSSPITPRKKTTKQKTRIRPESKKKEKTASEMALLAKNLKDEGKLDEALTWCLKAGETEKLEPGHRFLEGEIHLEAGRTEEAESAFRKTLFLDNDIILAHFLLGNLHLESGETVKAKRSFEYVLDLLRQQDSKTEIPFSDGLSAGQLSKTVKGLLGKENAA